MHADWRNHVLALAVCALAALTGLAGGAEEEEGPPFDELLVPAIRPYMSEELEAELITRATEGESTAVRYSAILTLTLSRCFTPEAIGAFTLALDDADADIRKVAVLALDSAEDAAAPAVPRLVQLAMSSEEDKDTRESALGTVLDLDESPEPGIAMLDQASGDWPRYLALYRAAVLAKNGREVAGNLEVIARVLQDSPDAERRKLAVDLLAAVGSRAGDRAVDLVAALEDPHPEVRVAAAAALAKTSPPPDIAVPPLLKLAMGKQTARPSSPFPDPRMAAVVALGTLGSWDPAAVDALLQIAEEGAPGARAVAIYELAALPIDHQRLVPAIQEALMGTGLTGSALLAIPKVPNPPPQFVRLIERAQPSRAAVLAVASIDGQTDDVRRALVAYARDTDPLVARPAVEELPKYATGGEATQEVVAALTRQLRSREPALVFAAVEALGEIGPPAAGALDELEALTEGRSRESSIYDGLAHEAKVAVRRIRAADGRAAP